MNMRMGPNGKNIEWVMKGTSFYRADVDEYQFKNLRLDVGPPLVDDDRECPPEKPFSFTALKLTSPNKKIPWYPHSVLCPGSQNEVFEKVKDLFAQCVPSFTGISGFSELIRLPKCYKRIQELYPCYHYLLRASAKESHGIDDMLELGVFL